MHVNFRIVLTYLKISHSNRDRALIIIPVCMINRIKSIPDFPSPGLRPIDREYLNLYFYPDV